MNTFKHKIVNDLYWSINSVYKHKLKSNIAQNYGNFIFSEFIDFKSNKFNFQSLDENPYELEVFVGEYARKPLGVYFESLCRFYFRNHPDFEVVFENHQIIKDKITLTEFDLCVKDVSLNKYYHIEFSVKFYLENINPNLPEDWIGPNAKDNFEKKLIKTEKQFLLANNYIDLNVEKVFFLKGLNFEYKSSNYWWCKIGEEQDLLKQEFYAATLPKQFWLGSNILKPRELNLLSKKEIIKEVKQQVDNTNKSVCIALFQKNNGKFLEKQRGFIVNKNWPN